MKFLVRSARDLDYLFQNNGKPIKDFMICNFRRWVGENLVLSGGSGMERGEWI